MGKTTSPRPVAKIQREIVCRTNYTEKLLVENWLHDTNQQFCVTSAVGGGGEDGGSKNKTNRTSYPYYQLLGNEFIDVSANSCRNYNWIINVANVAMLEMRIYFTNQKTKEYICYDICLNVKRDAGSLVESNIKFATFVRKPVANILKLENFLDLSASYNIQCSNNICLSYEQNVIVSPYSTVNIVILKLK